MTTGDRECDSLNLALQAAKSLWRVMPHRALPATKIELADEDGDSVFTLDRGVTVATVLAYEKLYRHGFENGRRVGEGMALRRIRQALGLGCA